MRTKISLLIEERVRELSLFTGAGGGVLASKLLGWTTVGYVEINEYCQKVLRQRIADGILDAAPIFGDIRKFISEGYAASYQGMVDVLTAGFPCSDISIVGKGGGIQGEKSGLWKETAECIRIIQPKRVLLENSPALTYRGLGQVLGDLARMGFDARWGVLSGAKCGAPHLRKRIWIVSDAFGIGRNGLEKDEEGRCARINSSCFEPWRNIQAHLRIPMATFFDNPMCGVLRNDDGLAEGMDRLEASGNGQVPIVAASAWKILSGL
jgi:DNA (cytosine-5)-methyltransferase 1